MFRLDRFLTFYFFHPLSRIKAGSGRTLPILMYHSISNDQETAPPYYRINTSPDVFEMHMKYLDENGYETIDFADIPNFFREYKKKAVIITFDDGFKDFYSEAYPILSKYKFRSTVFLSTALVGSTFINKKCLEWNDIRELNANGVSFGSHTVSHPVLANLPVDEIEKEISDSKKRIQDELGEDISVFSYPYRLPEDETYLKKIRSFLEKNGFKYGVSTRIGTTSEEDDVYFMKRIPVNTCDDVQFFEAKLGSGYDWLYMAQIIYKRLRRHV